MLENWLGTMFKQSILSYSHLSLPHGNNVPEKGFSINRKLIAVHGTPLSEEITEAQRIGILTF